MSDEGTRVPLGDRHDGKQTCLVTDGDLTYIYKPRGAETERAWTRFLRALRNAGFSHLPGCVQILSEDADSHRERIVQRAPVAPVALPEYYRRCGALLFFAWLFGGTDLHAENLIAAGDTPTPVDLETLFSGVEARTDASALRSLAWTVFRAHLLPQFDGFTDVSGFSGTNADEKNLPLAEGSAPFAPDHADEIVEGFTAAFRFAQTHDEVFSRGIKGFAKCRFRVLLRPTDTYDRMTALLRLLPEEQREAAAQTLIRTAYERDTDPDRVNKASAVIREETAAITRGDIPLFTVFGDGADLRCRDEIVLPGYLRVSPVDFALGRLSSLDEDELERQTALIRLSYDALRPQKQADAPVQSLSDALTALDACAVPHHPSSFIHLAADSAGKGYFESAGWGLYDGLAGILCAYAAVLRATGDERIRTRLEVLYEPLPRALEGPPAALTDRVCSLDDGLGGIIAALLHLTDLTGKARYADDAIRLAARLDAGRCTAERTDVLGGAGGLCLQLPKLPDALARPLAEALLPLFTETNPTLTGFAHGAAGQALCLAALQHTLPERDLREPILALLRWEDEQFDALRGNWPDLRRGKRTDFMGGWCSGAPGVGLARKRMLLYIDDPEIAALCRRDVDRAIRWLSQTADAHRDTLCCGSAARLTAAARLGAPKARYEDRLRGSMLPDSPRLYHMLKTADKNPGLMQGAGGVLYALAMADDPLIGEMLL